MGKNMAARHLKRVLGTAVITMSTVLLVHCGGGGGDSSVDDGTPPPGGVSGLNPGLTGKFWYRPDATDTYFQAQADDGSVSKFVVRPYSFPSKFLVPSPDGTKYILHSRVVDTSTDDESMSIEVYDSATKTRLHSFSLAGYAINFRFSPDNKYLGMVRSTGLLAHQEGLTVVDLADPAGPKTVVGFTGSATLFVADFDWLPNNQYMYLRNDNKLIVGTPSTGGNDDQVRGTITPPANHQTAYSLALSPDGSQMLLKFSWKDGPTTKIDVWMANATGGNLERITTSTMTASSLWSPDGQYIAMKSDAGAFCSGGACDSYCRRWYVPKTARGVTENSGGIELRSFAGIVSSQPVRQPCDADFTWTK